MPAVDPPATQKPDVNAVRKKRWIIRDVRLQAVNRRRTRVGFYPESSGPEVILQCLKETDAFPDFKQAA